MAKKIEELHSTERVRTFGLPDSPENFEEDTLERDLAEAAQIGRRNHDEFNTERKRIRPDGDLHFSRASPGPLT